VGTQEPVGFEDRADRLAMIGYRMQHRPILEGPLTLAQHRSAELRHAIEDAEQAQKNARNEEADAKRRELERHSERRENIILSGAKLTDEMIGVLASRTGPVDGRGMLETPAVLAVSAWLADAKAKPWLILSGSTGRGKTVASLDAIAQRGGTFVRARELARAFTARFGPDQELQARCFSTPLLVIDDVGRETDHDAFAAHLEDLLDERPNRSHRTIVTTNLDAAQWAAAYHDQRLRSRLAQLATFHGDAGPDMRRGTP
jgi:DNA replication protein DnaC